MLAERRKPHIFWLVPERPQVDLCLTDPGHEVDLHIDADPGAFAHVWLGAPSSACGKRMMLVDDSPAPADLTQADGQTKIERNSPSVLSKLRALHQRESKCDVSSGNDVQPLEVERHGLGLRRIEECPRVLVGLDAARLERRRHIEHRDVLRVMRENSS